MQNRKTKQHETKSKSEIKNLSHDSSKSRSKPESPLIYVQMSGAEAIEWPDLDVGLEIDYLRHPERDPLLIKRNELNIIKSLIA